MIAGSQRSSGAPSTRKILVAEDNAALQQILAQQFAHLDVSATIVGNGAEAVAALARESFALVFMDCHMPELDGFAATRAIRDARRRPACTCDHRDDGQRVQGRPRSMSGDRDG